MPSDRDTLLGMGFDSARVEWALKATSGKGLQPAMDHIFENEGKPIPESSSTEPMDVDDDENDRAGPSTPAVAGAEAKSIRCSECGKIFKNTDLANYHAEKSGHDQFEESTEEIKPLTEEEKAAKLEELRTKMAEKKKLKAIQDAAEAKEAEKIRRKSGKEQLAIKSDLEEKQRLKDAEQKRREKIEDEKAKARVKAQIEADKRERAERTAREKALREGRPITDNMAGQAASGSTKPAGTASVANSGVAGKDYKDTRLQIRLSTGGSPITHTFPSDSPLSAVAEHLVAQNAVPTADLLTFSTTFPRKQYGSADLSKSLRDLGLTPSAVLVATVG